MPVQTDSLHCGKRMQCLQTDVEILDDISMTKEAEKGKYKDQGFQISRMWQAKTRVVLVVVGLLKTYKELFDTNLRDSPRQQAAQEVYKMALMGHRHLSCHWLKDHKILKSVYI